MATSQDTLFYLLRKGTNMRIVNKDHEPVLVETDYVTELQDYYEQITRQSIVPMSVREWHRRFMTPVHEARAEAKWALAEPTG